jgi:hypothetical protein
VGVGGGDGGTGVSVGFAWGALMMTGVGVAWLGVGVVGGKSPPGTSTLQAASTSSRDTMKISRVCLVLEFIRLVFLLL